MSGGVHGGGRAWQGECAWQGACMVWGTCMARGVRMAGECVWQGGVHGNRSMNRKYTSYCNAFVLPIDSLFITHETTLLPDKFIFSLPVYVGITCVICHISKWEL